MSMKVQVGFRMGVSLLSLFVLLVSGCGGKDEGGGGGAWTAPSTGEVVTGYSAFSLQTTLPVYVPHYIHNQTSWTTACSISPNATARDLDCLFEINELDLYFQSFKLDLQVPAGMCNYVHSMPFLFWQYIGGYGPAAVEYRINDSDVITSVPVGAAGVDIVTGADGKQTVSCIYNYDSIDGPNCCGGKAVVTKIETDALDVETDRKTELVSWGGKPGECAKGPGAEPENAAAFDEDGFPQTLIYDTIYGTKITVEMKSPIGLGLKTNAYSANHIVNADPAAFTGLGRQYYEWHCLDHAWEMKARIRLRVREWNSYSEFVKVGTGDPDQAGPETDYPDVDLNDRADWDDFIDFYAPSALPRSAPGKAL